MAMQMAFLTSSMASLAPPTFRFRHPRVTGAWPVNLKAEKSGRGLVMRSDSETLLPLTLSPKGANVLPEYPPYDLPWPEEYIFPVEDGGDTGRIKDKQGDGNGDSYKVLLLDAEHHTEKSVAKLLPEAVPLITRDYARRLFNESRKYGVAVVIVTVKGHAEFYAQQMMRRTFGLQLSQFLMPGEATQMFI